MRELRLVAVSEDGTHLVLSDGDDENLALQVDERLHAAIRGDRARLGQLEIQLESQLRPRDIQARIRAGESVESVAAVAGMPLDKVRRFAGPVIAEREHIADRARQATMRRGHGDGPVRTLDVAAGEAAAAAGVDADDIVWDAWRRDDGRWQVRCSWESTDAESTALFSFDPSGRSVVPDDDAARVLAGELRAPAAAAPTLEAPGGARLSVVEPPADDEPADAVEPQRPQIVPAAEPVLDLARPDADDSDDSEAPDLVDDQPTVPVAGARRSHRPTRRGRPERPRRDNELWADDDATSERLRLSDIADRVETTDAHATGPYVAEGPAAERTTGGSDDAVPAEPEQPAARKAASGSRSRRPSVPSWDEIMFGRPGSE